MALDSLGLGLTLDTTLLEKADKTLENMHKNSKLIMQNLTRGFTAFNGGGADALTKMSTALGHVSDALTKIDNAKVSPDFDTKGQEKYINRMQQLLDIVEKMSKIRGAKFYDPTEVYATDKDASDILAEMGELQEYKKELAELVKITKNYDNIQRELKKTMYTLRGEIPAQKKEVDSLANAYNEAKKKQEAALKAMATQFKAFSTRERKKDSSLTEEQLMGKFAATESMQKYIEAVKKANEELVREEEKLADAKEKLEQKQASLRAAGKEYQSNWRVKQQEEENKLAYDNIKEREKILQKELEFSQATEAERAAMLTRKNEAEIKADQKRIRDVQKSYETLRKEIQKGEKDIAELEASRATLKEAGRPTAGIDKQIKQRRAELNKLMQDELEFRSSQYWPKLQEIDERFNNETFIKNQKALAKQAAKESRKDVTAALQYSKNAQSINEEKEAIKRLIEARDNLSTSTARYKKTVEDINKRILAHKDHIEAVTRVEKEQNTLADSVINRYRKQLKALDEVNEALEKQMKIERKTSVADLDPNNADTQALLARQKTITEDIKAIEKSAQGELDIIREQHDAERAKKRIDETLRQNEREKQEYAKLLDEKYALEKQRKAMDKAGIPFYETEYQNNIQQEQDVDNKIQQLRQKHLNDLADIDKAHNKKVNDDAIKERIAAEKEKLRIAEEYAKKQREKARKYGTISSASADRIIGATDNARNVNQHKRAIDSLQKARASLNATDKDYLKTVKRLNEAIKYHEIEIELTEEKSKNLMQTHRGLMDIGGQLMRRLALVFSVSQLTQYFRKLVEVRGEFEKTEVALTTILKSRAQANVLMNQITDLAVKSPFTLQQLVGYTKQLAAYQIEYKKLYSTTKMLADVSAGLGVEMDRLILAFGQVRAANFLRATEVRQFTEAGFDILGELAKHYSELRGEMVSVGEVQEMVTKRMVGFGDVEKVFQKVTSAGGIFYDMQAKQAETLAGQWSNLQDKISIMYNEIGKSTDGMLKGIVGFLASIIDNWEGAATVLKSLIATFAMVKINSMLTSKEMIKFARTMNVIKGRRKAITVIELFHAGFVKLVRSIKAAGAALKAFVVSNHYIAAIAALAGVIGAVVSKHNKQAEAVKEVSKRYDELHESITEANAAMLNAINEQDLEKQKDALKELVEMVDKEYNMKVNIDIESLTTEEIATKFNEIRDEVEKLNIFGAVFGSGLEGFKAKGQNALKDISQYGEAANELFKQMVDKSAMVASALQEIDAEKYKDIISDLVTPRDIMGGESELTYLNRLYEAYNKIKEESSIDLTWDEDTDKYIARTSENFYELGKILGEIDFKNLSSDYANSLKEFKDVEFIKYLDTLTDSLEGLTDEQKEKKLKFAIDTEAAHREWNAFVVQLMYEIANTKFGLSIKPEVEAPDVTKLEKWQENYKERFEKEEGYMPITSPSITQEAQIKALNEEYKTQYELLERIKNAGGESALEVGGAYEGLGKTMDEIAAEMEDLNAQIEYLGGTNTTIDKNEKASQKILNRRISILKEIHEAYNQARKDDLGHEEAVQKVTKDWGDTFAEAFEGTKINLTRVLIDQKQLEEFKKEGEKAGIVFSESMNEKMKEIFDSGTYIRSASKDILEFLKLEEGWRNKAYQDTSGIWTIGAGNTKQKDGKTPIKQGDYWTDDEIWENSQRQIKEHEDRLNSVLEKHRDILLTQEQYNVLLKATWQGQGTSVIPMAKSAEQFKTWLEEIDNMPIVKVLMNPDGTIKERKQVGLFDIDVDAIMQEYNSLESVYERMALVLKYTSNRMGKTKDTTQSMIDRSFKRSADFLGDTEINKLLTKASKTISDFDFSTPEGFVKALRGLMPIAKKEGKEAMLALSKEISKVENEVGVKIRLENVEQFEDDIDKALLNYKSWKDLKKLSVPNEVAASLFGVTPQSLEQVRKEVLEALNLGEDINLGNEQDVLAAVKLQYGEPTQKVVRNFLKNVAKMENDEQEERLKKYVEYAKRGLSERAKIKLEEMRQLEEIQKTFEIKEGDSDDVKAQKEDMAKRASENVRKESQEALNKLDWAEFEKSDMFIQVFDDLDNASTSLLSHLIEKIQGFKDAWTDMPLEDVEKIIDALNKLQTRLAESAPWKEFKKAKEDLENAKKAVKFEDAEAKKLSEKGGRGDYMAALDKEDIAQQNILDSANKQIAALEVQLSTQEKIVATTDAEKAAKSASIAETTKELDRQKGIKAAAEGNLKNTQKVRSEQRRVNTALAAQYQTTSKCFEMAVELGTAVKDLVETLSDDDPAAVFAEMGLNMLSTVANTLALQAQLIAARAEATGLGLAMNTAAGVIGWIVMAIQLLVTAISAAVNYAEKMRQMKLDVLAGQVENLKQKYDELAESIDKAYSTKQLQEYSKEIEKVQAKMEDAQKDYIKLLKAGDKKGKIDLAEQAQRKLDEGLSVDDLSKKERKALLSEEYQDYKEATEALAEMQKDHEEQKQDLLDSMGGVTDYKSAAQEFVDAWVDAFKETGDGLSGLQENFREFFDNVIKQEAMRRVTDKYMQPFFDDLNAALESESSLSEGEIADLKAKADKVAPELSKVLEELWTALGGSTGETSGGLSALQKGISSISEETAQVLEAYLNSVRMYVATISADTTSQLNEVKAIHRLLDSVTLGGHSRGGVGFKVFMD